MIMKDILLTDSRQLTDPQRTVFYALKTPKNDGARYINELRARGVTRFVTDNALQQLQQRVAQHRKEFSIPVIGISGSIMKTVLKDNLVRLLHEDYDICATPGSWNSQIGVPLSVWELEPHHTLGIFEAGISQHGEMSNLEPIIAPTIGIFTGIDDTHQEGFESQDQKLREMLLLFRHSEVVIYHSDVPGIEQALNEMCPKAKHLPAASLEEGLMQYLGFSDHDIVQHIFRLTPEARRFETVMQIDLKAVVHNMQQYRSHLKPETKLTCMVKAFGYGTGSYELARCLESAHADYLAVAVADEGAELRRKGIRMPIIVMNPEMSSFRTIIENRLEPEIYSFRLLDAFIDTASRIGVSNWPVHIKIDSGMHRLGFQQPEIALLIERLKAQHSVRVASIFSHFATADDPTQEDFVHEQRRRYDLCADPIRAAFLEWNIIRHICNSAGIESYPQYQMEMCRLGIGLYGYEASPVRMGLQPVATLLSTILQIKEIPATETVGYMRNGKLSRTSRIAMVPIGYADGYDRRLGNGHFYAMVQQNNSWASCPTVGNVCMDVIFLDVTDCPDAHEGSKVELFGPHLPLPEMSSALGTITYEVLSTISNRVPRLYI